jgi:diacylglycerol kinase
MAQVMEDPQVMVVVVVVKVVITQVELQEINRVYLIQGLLIMVIQEDLMSLVEDQVEVALVELDQQVGLVPEE